MGNPSEQSQSPKPTGFAQVAKQISSRTTDLLAIAIILVAGLSMGGRLIEWWSTDPDDVLSAKEFSELADGPLQAVDPFASWEIGSTPVSLEFGESPYTVTRKTVIGDPERATDELIEMCRDLLVSTKLPIRPVDEAERKLLQYVESSNTAIEQVKDSRIDFVDGPVKLVVATRLVPRRLRPGTAKRGLSNDRRVVCWGLTFPAAKEIWTLFTFHPSEPYDSTDEATGENSDPQWSLPKVPLPPGSRRILSLRMKNRGRLITFQGEGPPENWTRFFDGWFQGQGWKAMAAWKSSGRGWSVRFAPQDRSVSGRADVQFSQDGRSRLTGLISVTSVKSKTQISPR